ncbi:anti-sigma regulatory factor [Burkholderia glumae]|uniref:ATP-binding protein n=1 Tax=Burkholderia glumae TaxID=337 RepID=UPI000F5E20A8|nr:ATP-binding protein [Burkholderia glumae]MCQ0032843.1 ATP-binding protein [Burkholderia glumae]MCQ0040062.1 ATP-binding protein [Burkholderia glumae]QJW77347.1 anti-sigma regulatory factor [Burkholderia glumae]RQZ75176.1 anti-sigma regulatory factor [Burkholderia glumae]UVS84932.1 anti-sigma regulatory factor [Burkholderia glumae]
MEAAGLTVVSTTRVGLRSDQEIVKLRQLVRDHAIALGLSLVDQTKFVTAASELARNTLLHGGGGDAELSVLERGPRKGLRVAFIDTGPGIADVDRALQDGFTTAGGLGLGLGGARRLSDEFQIETERGKGTRITIAKWKIR